MLDQMKEKDRSKHSSPTVVKKRNSSGCLIIKKKVTDSEFNDSTSRNLSYSTKKKKRQRVVTSDSEQYSDSSSETETTRRKVVDKFHKSSGFYKGAYMKDREVESDKRVSNGSDVNEVDKDNGLVSTMNRRKDANDGRYQLNLRGQSSNIIAAESKFDMEEDEFNLPLSVLCQKYRSSSSKSFRLQGKNGVLKVMVNKNKQRGVSRKSYVRVEDEDHKESNLRVLNKKKSHVCEDSNKIKAKTKSSLYSNSKHAGKPAVSKKSKQTLKSYSRGEAVKTPTKDVTQVKDKGSKVQRGSGTEKQILREKIKNMLLGAGWTIDYRPRRNRDYMDAVYINPGGTGYWSIIKAYDALQKEEEDNSKTGGRFTPLPEDLLGKLTRQTQKKREREMKRKRKNVSSDKKEMKHKHRHKSKKSRLEEESQDNGDNASENSNEEMYDSSSAAKTMVGTSSGENKKIGRCPLLVRGSDKGLNSENDGFVPYSGKRTILSWIIDSGVVQMSEHVEYMNRKKTRVLQKGWITKDGIHCGCCSNVVSVSKFELHAGSKLRQPFPNMFVKSGKSLLQCQIDAWKKHGELEKKGFYAVDTDGDDPNDDTCGLCGDGGDLICCDGCPSTFHQSCLDLQMLPQGDWHCQNCCCKYCQIASGNSTEVGRKTETSLLTCCLCQKKYHESCRQGIDAKPTASNNMNLSFCQQTCHEQYSRLQKLLGVKHELDSGFSWSLIHRSDLSTDASSEFSRRLESNSLVAVAMSIMDECFLPFIDGRSKTNLIRHVVFNCGSNLSRLNYSGFFTAILEKGDEMLSAACIRIHGTQLAEMPFIGTRHVYRRQGMCRRLLSAIESALSSLQVEKLVIPAVAERMHTWTDIFGFLPLEESHKQELKSLNMLVFPGTDMLQKSLVKQANPCAMPEGNDTDEVDEHKVTSSSVKESNDKIATTDSGSQESNVPLDDGCPVPDNSPDKGEKPLAVSGNKSEFASGDHNAGDDASKTDVPDSNPVQVSDIAVSYDIPCDSGLQLSSSLDKHFESNLEESTAGVGSKITPDVVVVPSSDICDPEHQMPGNESVSPIHSHSNTNGEEISMENGEESNLLPTQVNDMVPSVDVQKIDVQKGCETTNNTTEFDLLESEASNQPLKNAVTSESLQAKSTNVPLEDIISSDLPCEHEIKPCGVEENPSADTEKKPASGRLDQNAGDDASKSIDPDSNPAQVSDIVVSSDIPCDSVLQLSGSGDKSFESNVEEPTAQIGSNIMPEVVGVSSSDICEPKDRIPGKESVSSIHSVTDSNVEETSVENERSNPLQTEVSDMVRCVDIQEIDVQKGRETTDNTTDVDLLEAEASNQPLKNVVTSESLEAKAFNVPLKDIISSDLPCEHELQPCGLESRSLDAPTTERVGKSSSDASPVILEATTDTTDVNSLEAVASHVPSKNAISSYSPCEHELQPSGLESCSLGDQTAETLEKPSSDDSPVILEATNNATDVNSLEAEASDAPVKDTISPYSPCESELQLCGVEDNPTAETEEKRASGGLYHNAGDDASKAVDPNSDPVQVSDIAVSSDIPCDSGLQLSASVDKKMESNVEEISMENGEESSLLPTQVNDLIPCVDIQEIELDFLEAEASNRHLKNAVTSDLPCERELEPCGVETTNDTTDVKLLEAEASDVPLKDTISSNSA